MTIQQEISSRLKAHPSALWGESADSFKQVLVLCKSPLVRALDEEIVVNPAEEIRRIWATRLRIAAAKQRTIEGAQALVAALDRLSPAHGVEQMSVEAGQRVGIVFFDEMTHEPLGAILKVWTAADAPQAAETAELPRREQVLA